MKPHFEFAKRHLQYLAIILQREMRTISFPSCNTTWKWNGSIITIISITRQNTIIGNVDNYDYFGLEVTSWSFFTNIQTLHNHFGLTALYYSKVCRMLGSHWSLYIYIYSISCCYSASIIACSVIRSCYENKSETVAVVTVLRKSKKAYYHCFLRERRTAWYK